MRGCSSITSIATSSPRERRGGALTFAGSGSSPSSSRRGRSRNTPRARWDEADLMVEGAARSGVRLARVLGCGYSILLPRTAAGARLLPDALGRARYLERSDMAIREWFGYGIYWLRGYAR